jgi:hypothetical protein
MIILLSDYNIMIKDEVTGWFAIGGIPIGEGYGIDVDNDTYSCYSGMTTRVIHMTKDDIITLQPINQDELTQIKHTLEKYSQCELFQCGYALSEFIGWIINGCDISSDVPYKEAIQAICLSRGRLIISDLTQLTISA